MKRFLKANTLAALAAFAILSAGAGTATAAEDGAMYVAEDTTRGILATLHSRLDAFRKVRVGVIDETTGSAAIAAPAVAVAVTDGALGSLVLPDCNYGARYLNRFWGGGLGSWQSAGERDDSSGYKYDGQGVILGYDRAFGAVAVGIAASFIEGDYEDKSFLDHDSKIKQYSAHAYGTYNTSRGFFFTLTGGYTYSDNDLRESDGATTYAVDYRANTFNAGVKAGFDFEPGATVVITPSVGANFFYAKARDHDVLEDGVPGGYRYEDVKHNMVELPLDVQVAKEFDFGKSRSLQLSANGGYAYNLNDKAVTAEEVTGGTAVRVTGRRLGHHAWKAGAGVRFKTDQWDAGIEYDYLGRSNYNSHRVMGTVGFSF